MAAALVIVVDADAVVSFRNDLLLEVVSADSWMCWGSESTFPADLMYDRVLRLMRAWVRGELHGNNRGKLRAWWVRRLYTLLNLWVEKGEKFQCLDAHGRQGESWRACSRSRWAKRCTEVRDHQQSVARIPTCTDCYDVDNTGHAEHVVSIGRCNETARCYLVRAPVVTVYAICLLIMLSDL